MALGSYGCSEASKAKFLAALEAAWSKLIARGLASDPAGFRAVRCVFNIAECVADADYVQESVVEDLQLKQQAITIYRP